MSWTTRNLLGVHRQLDVFAEHEIGHTIISSVDDGAHWQDFSGDQRLPLVVTKRVADDAFHTHGGGKTDLAGLRTGVGRYPQNQAAHGDGKKSLNFFHKKYFWIF